MIRPQLILDLSRELIIDNFAGGGGASTGIEMALGRHVDHAINHDRLALGMHRINHPQTLHHWEDVFDIVPAIICEGRPVGLAHFSPDCKHFSKAKGGKPLDKRIRGLVLIMLRWAKYGARVMTMENVVEIQTWGPLIRMRKKGVMGWYPDPRYTGRTWRAFLDILSGGISPDHPDLPEIIAVLGGTVTKEECVAGFGYAFEAREIRACDQGSPTIRKRLFMVARRDGMPIVFPEATHFEVPHGRKELPWRTIAECIDFSLRCPSIFLDRQQAKLARCRRPLAPATLRRVATGIDRYVLKSKKPFLVSLTHQGGDRVESIDEPVRTLTGAHRGEKAVVCPVLTEHANSSTQRNFPADEPLRTQCAEVKGGHFALVAGSLVGAGGRAAQSRPRGLDEPLHSTTAKGDTCLASVNLVQTGTIVHTAHGDEDANGKKRGRGAHDLRETMPSVLGSSDVAFVAPILAGAGGPAYSGKPKPLTQPLNTQTTENHAAVVAASLVKMRGDNVGQPADEPIRVISAGGTHHAVVAASVVRHFGNSVGQGVDSPAPTVTAGGGGKTGVVAVHLTKYYGEKKEGEVRGQCADEPLHTQPTENRFGVVAAYVAQHNGGFNETPGHEATAPISTISGTGSQQQVVAASVAAYYGSEQDGQAVTEPARSITAKARLGLVESELIVPELTEEQIAGARRVAAFLREHGVKFEGEFATVAGFVIVDIGMRMLTPRELFRAQGFGDAYIIDRAWVVNPENGEVVEVLLTKEQQIRMCGNSVCPQVEAALIRANVPELGAWFKNERRMPREKAMA